jgi:hypothetical protein
MPRSSLPQSNQTYQLLSDSLIKNPQKLGFFCPFKHVKLNKVKIIVLLAHSTPKEHNQITRRRFIVLIKKTMWLLVKTIIVMAAVTASLMVAATEPDSPMTVSQHLAGIIFW